MRTPLIPLLALVGWVFFPAIGFAAWPGVAYEEVRAFAWPPSLNVGAVILPEMKVAKKVLNPKGAVLSPKQVERLLQAEGKRYVDRPLAACYVPHNAFVFYDAAKKPVAFLEICFDCLGSRTGPDDPQCDPEFETLAQIFSELKLPFGDAKTVAELRRKMPSWETQPTK